MSSLADTGLDWLLREEDCDNDDRRFYCSYLIGHISLVTGEANNNPSFIDLINESLAETLPADNLTDNDKLGIQSLWLEVCQLNADS